MSKRTNVSMNQEQLQYLLDVLLLDLQNLREFKQISRGNTQSEDREIAFVQRLFGKINGALAEVEAKE